MKSKIRVLQDFRILLDGSAIELHLSEAMDGDWDLSIREFSKKKLRIAIPVNDKTTHHLFYNYIVGRLNGENQRVA